MFKDGFVMVLIGLVLAGGIYVLWTTRLPFSSRVAGMEQSSAAETSRSVETKTPAPKVTIPTKKATHNPAADNVTPAMKQAIPEIPGSLGSTAGAEETKPVVANQGPPPPFPTVDKISPGIGEDSITGRFGDPSLSALTSTGRHVVETFVYAKDRGRSATVIRLQDGRVANAYTQSEPVHASGLSVPPRTMHKENAPAQTPAPR